MKGIVLLRYSNSTTRTATAITVNNAITLSTYDNRTSGSISSEQRRGKKKSAKENEKKKMKKEKRKQNRRPGRFNELKALYDEDKNQYYLPTGTIVKHGTTTNNLKSILDHGILPAFQRGRIGRTDKTMNTDGVYVGSCFIPYRTCLMNFVSGFGALIRNSPVENGVDVLYGNPQMNYKKDTSAILTEYRNRAIFRYTTPKKECISKCGLPVVLNITLKENVFIEPDEDFLPAIIIGSLENTSRADFAPKVAKEVWEQFGSTVLPQHIPSNWISSVEFLEPHRPRSYLFEQYVLQVENEFSLSLGHGINRTLYHKIRAEEDAHFSASVHKYKKDLDALIVAEECFYSCDVNSRNKWHTEVVNRRQSFCAFSCQCDIKEAHVLLDKLNHNNSIEMLATAYQLYLDYCIIGKERGFYDSKNKEIPLPSEYAEKILLHEFVNNIDNKMIDINDQAIVETPDGDLDRKTDENHPPTDFFSDFFKK